MKFPAPLPLPNRADRSILPAILAVVLAALVAAQFVIVEPADQPLAAGRSVVPAVGQLDVRPTTADPIILRSAIFAPGRGTGFSAGSAPLGGAQFVGVVKVRGFARAVLQEAGGGAVSVPLGGRYRGWKLTALNNQNAAFIRDNIRHNAPMARGLLRSDLELQSSQDSEQ